MRTALIVARANNGVIGRNNQLPWHLPADLRYFKQITLGKPVIMGRNTFESIGRPLPGRTNVVLTATPGWQAPGVRVVADLEKALTLARAQAALDGVDEVMVIGGARVYGQAMAWVDRLYVTEVDVTPEGDAHFDAPDPVQFALVAETSHPATETEPAHSFQVWDRRA